MLITLTIIVLIFLFILSWKKYISSLNLPPGPLQLPIIGSTLHFLQYIKNKEPYKIFSEIGKKYGQLSYLTIGSAKILIIEDNEVIKEVLNSESWTARHSFEFINKRSFNKPLGILFSSGPSQREMRKFTIKTLTKFGFGIQSVNNSLIDEHVELVKLTKEKLGTKNETEINMSHFFTASIINVIWKITANLKFTSNDELHKFLNHIDEINYSNPIGDLRRGPLLFSAFPFLEKILPSSQNFNIESPELVKYFKKVLEKRKILANYKNSQKDFVDVFLNEIDAYQNDKNTNFTDEQLVTLLTELFLAGGKTTSKTLEFTFSLMVQYPEIQTKVQKEIDTVIGKDRSPTWKDKENMPFTTATLLEIERFSNIVPINMRCNTVDTKIKSYNIPKGTIAILNLYGVNMNEKMFIDPHKFCPARFLDENGKVINSNYLQTFGGGKRGCIGKAVARSVIFTYFTSFLQQFTFGISKCHGKPSAGHTIGLTLGPLPYYSLVKERD